MSIRLLIFGFTTSGEHGTTISLANEVDPMSTTPERRQTAPHPRSAASTCRHVLLCTISRLLLVVVLLVFVIMPPRFRLMGAAMDAIRRSQGFLPAARRPACWPAC